MASHGEFEVTIVVPRLPPPMSVIARKILDIGLITENLQKMTAQEVQEFMMKGEEEKELRETMRVLIYVLFKASRHLHIACDPELPLDTLARQIILAFVMNAIPGQFLHDGIAAPHNQPMREAAYMIVNRFEGILQSALDLDSVQELPADVLYAFWPELTEYHLTFTDWRAKNIPMLMAKIATRIITVEANDAPDTANPETVKMREALEKLAISIL